MGWKEWPYWLKGGIISISLFILLTLILLPFGEPGGPWSFSYYLYPSLLITLVFIGPIIIPLRLMGIDIAFPITVDSPLNLLITIPLSFAIGAIISLIVGKIKSRKK